MPASRPGADSAAAISVTLSDEVFDAITADGGASFSTSARRDSLSSIRSGAASMMKSADDTAAARSVVVRRRAFAAVASAAVTFPSSTPLSTMAAIARQPASTAACATSYIVVS